MSVKDWWENFHLKEYKKGQEAVAQEVDGLLIAQHQGMVQKIGVIAAESIALANRLAEDDDPNKRRIARVMQECAVKAFEHVASGTERQRAEEVREAVEQIPFSSGSSNQLETSFQESTQKALPNEATEPPKPKRGRPRKHPKK